MMLSMMTFALFSSAEYLSLHSLHAGNLNWSNGMLKTSNFAFFSFHTGANCADRFGSPVIFKSHEGMTCSRDLSAGFSPQKTHTFFIYRNTAS